MASLQHRQPPLKVEWIGQRGRGRAGWRRRKRRHAAAGDAAENNGLMKDYDTTRNAKTRNGCNVATAID